MKVLLTTLNAKYVHANLALKYLYTAAKKTGIDVEIREFTINNEMGYIYGEIVRGGYDLVCFSCYIWNIEKTKELAADVKRACPKLKILLGGPEVSYEAADFLEENDWADCILRGEGEAALPAVLRSFSCAEEPELSHMSGLTYRRAGRILETGDRPPQPLSEIPFPYRFLPLESDRVIYYESSRGCPYRCSYCLSSLEKSVRPLPLERVKEELSLFLAAGVRQVKFIDRTFNYDRERACQIWQYLIEEDNGVTNFHFEICGDLLDDRTLCLLAGAREGLFQFEIGIQSTNPRALAAIDRRTDTAKVLENSRALAALGNSHVHVDLIAGLPYEDYSSFGRSFDQVYAVGADNLQLGFLKLLKGTKLRRSRREHGYVCREKAPYEIIANRYLSAEELVRLKMIETVFDLYENRGGFLHSLTLLLERTQSSPFAFYERFSAFYFGQGYQHRSHKKEDLYRILFRFAKELEGEFSEIVNPVRNTLERDLEETMNFDAVKKFHKKGWEI